MLLVMMIAQADLSMIAQDLSMIAQDLSGLLGCIALEDQESCFHRYQELPADK